MPQLIFFQISADMTPMWDSGADTPLPTLWINGGKYMRLSGILPRRRREREILPGRWERQVGYFDMHPLSEIVRGVVSTSVAWGLLAVGVYAVYAMVAH